MRRLAYSRHHRHDTVLRQPFRFCRNRIGPGLYATERISSIAFGLRRLGATVLVG